MREPRTLFDKIWQSHVVQVAYDGTCRLYIDRHLVHEVTHPQALFAEVRSLLRPGGHFFVAEPRGHVSLSRFVATAELARASGFEVTAGPHVRFSRAVVCTPSPSSPAPARG